jgi:hypothetical protein
MSNVGPGVRALIARPAGRDESVLHNSINVHFNFLSEAIHPITRRLSTLWRST